MKNTLIISALCATTALVSSNALAQNSSSSSSGSASSQQNSDLQQANTQAFFRASEMTSRSAVDTQGNKVGSIKDIVFNQQGEIFALVDIGNSKWAAIPWQVVNPSSATGNGNVKLNATAQQIKAGPAVSEKQFGSLDNPQFVKGAYAYYNVQAPTASGGASSVGGSSQGSSSDQSQK